MSQLDELRQIIVGDNTEQLSALKDRIESVEERTRDVSEVLAPAIDATMRRDDSLIQALSDPVSESLKRAIRVEPDAYAEILYPAIAPSIRTAIAQAISSMLATINKTIESATTVGGLKARFKSIRTGVPYAELLLRQSLLFRVEHLYLIDRDSGLLIGECGAEDEGLMDSDAVGAMFSAIQSFVQDSFSGREDDRLTDFKVGEHTIWIAHGPNAMLACVILGDPPAALKIRLYETLESIRIRYAEQLQQYDGDASQFARLDDYMQPMLQSQLREEELPEEKPKLQMGPLLVYLAIAAVLGYLIFQALDRESKLSTLHHYFDAAPGVVVTKANWQDGKIVVEGLLDPDAILPLKTLSAHGIEQEKLQLNLTPFRSLETEMELRRFEKELNPPEGIELSVENGELNLSGHASVVWLLRHDERLRQLQADRRLGLSNLFATDGSLNSYLATTLNIPAGPGRSEALAKLSQTPWVEISFTEVLRDLLRSNRR